MSKTILAAFDSVEEADNAANLMRQRGFNLDEVRVIPPYTRHNNSVFAKKSDSDQTDGVGLTSVYAASQSLDSFQAVPILASYDDVFGGNSAQSYAEYVTQNLGGSQQLRSECTAALGRSQTLCIAKTDPQTAQKAADLLRLLKPIKVEIF